MTSRPTSVAFKMVAKFVVAEAVKNQEFFRDNVVNFIEFSTVCSLHNFGVADNLLCQACQFSKMTIVS